MELCFVFLRVCDLPSGRDMGDFGRPWLLMFLALRSGTARVHEVAALFANLLPPKIHGPFYLALCVVCYRLYGSYTICSCAILIVLLNSTMYMMRFWRSIAIRSGRCLQNFSMSTSSRLIPPLMAGQVKLFLDLRFSIPQTLWNRQLRRLGQNQVLI